MPTHSETSLRGLPGWLRRTSGSPAAGSPAALCRMAVLLAVPVVLCLASLGWPGHPLAAQTAEFEGQVEVSEVLLDVLVTDDDGNVVIGLEEDDFVVEEDGEPVEVVSVSFYSNRRFLGSLAGAPPADPPADIPEDRYFVLFFHRPPLHAAGVGREHFLHLAEAGRRAFEWGVKELLPSDHVAVVSFGTSLQIYEDFTRDRERLGRAIRRASLGRAPEERWTSRTPEPDPQVNLVSLLRDDQLPRKTRLVAEALDVLGQALGTIQGRKNLIVFGANLPAVHSTDWLRHVEPMVETLNDNNVATYTIGVTPRGRQPSLEVLAEETGGEYLHRFTDFGEPLRQIAQENSGYYLISYRTRHPAGEEGYQEVTVRTKDDGFRVRSRSGYRYGG